MSKARLEQISNHLAPAQEKPLADSARAQIEAHLNLIRQCLEINRPDEAARHAVNLYLSPPKHKTTPEARQVLQCATRSSISVDNQNIAFYSWGPVMPTPPSHATPTVFLSHGFGFSVATFAPLIVKLLASAPNCRILAVDHAAHGASTGSIVDLGTIIRTIQKVAVDFGPLSAIATHSVGGSATIMALAEMPGLLRYGAKVVLVNPPMQAVTVMQIFCKAYRLPPTLIPAMDALLPLSPSHILKGNLGAMLSGLDILLINGKDERIAPLSESMLLVESLRECAVQLQMTTGLDHTGIMENESVVSNIAQFLRGDNEQFLGPSLPKIGFII